MYDKLVQIAMIRPLTAADWMNYIGQYNWLVFERTETLGQCPADEPWLTGVVYKFKVIRTFEDTNMVRIEIYFNYEETHCWSLLMDADELAIRMEES